MRAEYLIIPFFFVAPTLFGQDEKVDFSEGLKRIAALGLPDMKGAEWVKLPDSNEQRFTNSYELTEMDIKPSGNTWKLKTDPPTYIDFGSNQTIELPKEEGDSEEESDAKPSMLQKMLNNHKKQNPEEEKAAKPKAPEDNVARAIKDAAKMVEALGKADAAENLNSSLSYSYSNSHGRLMLFAVQLHAAGQTESANALAAALFQAANDDSALIDGAISHLADNEYDSIATKFFETTDWQAYQKSLTALLEKFPRGWSNRPAVAMLVSNLEKRSATPPKPSIPGVQLKPEAVALLDQLLVNSSSKLSDEALAEEHGLDLSEYPPEHRGRLLAMLRAQGGSGRGSSENLWLLKTAKTTEPEADGSPTAKLKAMGMDGLIALAAVANDPTLTPFPNPRNQDSYYSSDETPEENLQKRYLGLLRPTSRGEIVSSILAAVIPTPEGDPYSSNSQPDPAVLGETAIAFWKANKDKSPVELATVYISEGNDSQKSLASSFLATSKDPAAHAAFEKTVLASTDPVSLITQVDQYISARKLEAKSFANAYIKLVQENPPDEQQLMRNSAGYVIREAGGLDNYLKRLSLKVGDVSLDKMIADALKAKPKEPDNDDPFSRRGRRDRNSPIAALSSSIQSISINECLLAFGKAAKVATPEQWMEMHHVLLRRANTNAGYGEPGVPAEPDKDAVKLSKEVIELWKPLLTRTEPIPKNDLSAYFIGYGAKTTGDASTLLLELFTSPEMIYGLRSIAEIQDSPTAIMEFTRKRVTAWTSGQEPEPWPSNEIVSEDRQEEISTKLPTLKVDEIIPYAKSLNLNERLVLMGIIESFSEENSTPPNLLELRQIIVSLKPVFDQDHDAEAAAKLGIKVGDRLTPELITKISDDFLKEPAANSKTTVSFMPAFMNLGVALSVQTIKELTESNNKTARISYLAHTFEEYGNPAALSLIESANSSDARVIKDGKVVTLESDESAITEFTKELQAKAPYISYVIISILTREDAEKIISNL